MNRSRSLAAVFSAILFFIIFGCNVGPNPKDVLTKYLNSYFQGNYDKAYEYLSSKDKAIKNQHEFSVDFKDFGGLAKAFAGKITFTIKEVTVTGDKALATVEVTAPDLSGAMGELFGVALKSAFSGGKPDCSLTQNNNTVTGTMTSQSDNKTANITGSVDGSSFIYSMAAGGSGATITLVHQVSGSTMTASSASGYGSHNGTQVQISSYSGTLAKQ